MKDYIDRLPKELKSLIYAASDIARKKDMPAYLVGGFVRDLLLGVKNLDLDIVVEGDGIEFAHDLSRCLKAGIRRHRRFGTATITLRHNLKIDIASARKEVYPEPAALPVVSAGNLKDDLARRDFTINAMAASINKKDFGRLLDSFGGASDLKRKKIRVLHALSFIDDPTRILRAIRFEKRYGFRIEPKTLSFLKQAVDIKLLRKLEPQRLRDELVLMLKEKEPLKQLRRLQQLAGLDFISPGLTLSASAWKLLNSAGRQIKWFKRNYPRRRPLDIWLIYFIAVIDSLRANGVRTACAKMHLPRGDEKRILSYKSIGIRFISELKKDGIKPSRIFKLLEPLTYEVILLIKAKYAYPGVQRHIEDFFEIYNGMRLLICGHDLKRLGLAPGPSYQKIFSKALEAKLEGRVKTRGQEMELIKRMIDSR